MIENTTVNGRPALVAYLDDQFAPVDQAQATLVKVSFTDARGEVVFMVPATDEQQAEDRRRQFRLAKLQAEKTLARTRRLARDFDPNQPRDEQGRWTETGADDDGADAGGIPGYKPGVKGRGEVEVKLRRDEWVAASPIKTIDDIVRAAPIAQKSFGEAGDRIVREMPGVEFKNPGEKTRSAKGIERTKQKIAERNGLTARVTDTARGAFIVSKPEQAEEIIHKLARTHEVVAEPWRTIPSSHYTDRALLFRDRATGLIGEVQIMDAKMWEAKMIGHALYEEARVLPQGHADIPRLEAEMRAIYDPVLDSYDDDWKAVDGRGGRLGKSLSKSPLLNSRAASSCEA